MADPQTPPPVDDDQATARNDAKAVVKEALGEYLEELKAAEAEKTPERTKQGPSIWNTLFGG